jgi:hypothetical protein
VNEKQTNYEAPVVVDIGELTDLTGGDKFNSLADFQAGQVNGPPGS